MVNYSPDVESGKGAPAEAEPSTQTPAESAPAMARRSAVLLTSGAIALAGAALLGCDHAAAPPLAGTGSPPAGAGLSSSNEDVIRRWYKGWEKKDWPPLDALLADDFTFSSAAGDDHISKAAFKKNCWETQIDHMARMDVQRIYGSGDEAFVMYVGLTKNGKTFRNVEYLRLKDGKIEAIECYFGDQSNFPSAVSTGQR
jgi:ketosteroid isomerase-like protein